MLGKSHMIVGATSFLAVGYTAAEVGVGRQLTPAEIGCGTLIAAGAALLPDLDCPQATIARSLGPVSHALSVLVNKLAGGHRKGTHSLLAAVLLTILLRWSLYASFGPYVAFGVAVLCASMCLRLLTEARGLVCASLAAIVAVTVTTITPTPAYMLAAVVFGVLSHYAADIVTTEGIPLFWPFIRSNQRFPVVGHTGGWRERAIAGVCSLLCLYLLAAVLIPVWRAAHQPAPVQRTSVLVSKPHTPPRATTVDVSSS